MHQNMVILVTLHNEDGDKVNSRKSIFIVSAFVIVTIIAGATFLILHTHHAKSTFNTGIFTADDLSIQDEKEGQRLFIGMESKQILNLYPDYMAIAKQKQFTFLFDSAKRSVEAFSVEEEGKHFSTFRGIRIGDSEQDVERVYGTSTFHGENYYSYVFRKEGSNLILIANSEALANESTTSNLYTISFGFTLKKPKVLNMQMSSYERGQKDPVAEGIKSIRISSKTIPNDVDDALHIYNKYLEEANIAHIQFENNYNGYEEYRRLDEISLQKFTNYINILKNADDAKFPPGFKADMISLAEEGYHLIDDRSRTKRNSDPKIDKPITKELVNHRRSLVALAEKYGSAVPDDSFIYTQQHLDMTR
jgi:hypothetical protein